jgi:hypothetical protein
LPAARRTAFFFTKLVGEALVLSAIGMSEQNSFETCSHILEQNDVVVQLSSAQYKGEDGSADEYDLKEVKLGKNVPIEILGLNLREVEDDVRGHSWGQNKVGYQQDLVFSAVLFILFGK